MMRPFVFVLLLVTAPVAIAQSHLYRCDASGTIAYQGTPCATGVEKEVRLLAPPDQADVQAALGRFAKAEAQQKVESQAMLNQQQRVYHDNQRAYQAMLDRYQRADQSRPRAYQAHLQE